MNKKGADVNIQNKNGKTALMIAKEFGYTEIVELLKQAGAKE
ncbi:MAG: ankyrin repeat domain-containing protein [bacterium]|nr:ankyrin repeat domain-containing protein [bacterium]